MAKKRPTLQARFDRNYEVYRKYLSIHFAAVEALKNTLGNVEVSRITGGYYLAFQGHGQYSGDNEEEFFQAARKLASLFPDPDPLKAKPKC
jgi:hypothetical protein